MRFLPVTPRAAAGDPEAEWLGAIASARGARWIGWAETGPSVRHDF